MKILQLKHIVPALILVFALPMATAAAQTATQKLNAKQLDELLKDSQRTPELQSLPNYDLLQDVIPGLVKLSLQLAGVIGFAVAIYAGILMVTARGNDEQVKKAKEILLYAVVAIVVISSAFAIVSGIVSFKF